MSDILELPSNYYIFSAFFEKTESSYKSGIGEKYEHFHELPNNADSEKLKNVRPLSFIPVVSESPEGDRELWATDVNYRLCSLSDGSQEGESDSDSLLNHTSPVHHLTQSRYKLTFPPIDMLIRLSQGNKAYEKVLQEIKIISDKVSSDSIEFSVTEIKPSQLAAAYKPDDHGKLTAEQDKYNTWRERVVKENVNLKGFILPNVATCVVVFSNKHYLNATVSLQKYDKNGNKLLNGDLISQVILPEYLGGVDDNAKPFAVFYLEPEQFNDGYYSINIVFDEKLMHDGKIPEFISKSNINFVGNELNEKYQYELREFIKVVDTNPLGKFAIFSGDMISLEESLIYQFPQYLGRMKKYLSGKYDLDGVSSPAIKSLVTLKSVAATTSQIFGGYASGTWGQMIQEEGQGRIALC